MENRKALKDAYKELKIPMGIYCIKNTCNGKCFIGKSMNLTASQNRFQFSQTNSSVFNFGESFNSDWAKFGKEKFAFEILEYLKIEENDEGPKPETRLEALEEKWLDKLKPFGENGYNVQKSKIA